MTIASAFNDITEKLGGTPSNSGTIASAIDALNDVLAGSDQPAVQTIEGAVALLGEHIGTGGGGGGTEYAIHCYTTDDFHTFTPTSGFMMKAVYDDGSWVQSGQVINKAEGGDFLVPDPSVADSAAYCIDPPSESIIEIGAANNVMVVMPKAELAAITSGSPL